MIDEAELLRTRWHKSTWSGGDQGGCVSVAHLSTRVAVRDSKNPGRYMVVSLTAWRAFLAAVKRGEFDHVGRDTRVRAPAGSDRAGPDRADERRP
ncbi:DUF397 domain-containing protein [Nonomuraea lactucae]|uniref:DUF397 domain-containing protein n=1 Tax=Nonomuraea lactucae TaxID=2249762 RepID=UPI0023DCF63D|nr:DUF397 domain-containing protein [Nonomuraea lactucae]